MLDVKLLRDHPDFVRELCRLRGADLDVDRLLGLDEEFRQLTAEDGALRNQRKTLEKSGRRDEAKALKARLEEVEGRLRAATEERARLLDRLPNLIAPDTPLGDSDAGNLEIARWGEPPAFGFEAQGHDRLGERLGILDLKRGAKASGSGFYYWVGDGARLFAAVYAFVEEFLEQRGFRGMRTPLATRAATLYGTGYLPFFEQDMFKLEGQDLTLIGTSEQTILAYRGDEILEAAELPLRYSAFSACFRSEAGAAGRATRGAFRVHQFHKAEQIVICRPGDSERWHLACQRNVEDLMQVLGLPYRVVRVCIGDMGAPGYKKYDVEGWFPGFGEYRETHSNTNLLDFQSRRLKLRCRDGDERFFPHTISATAISDRGILAIMENNQTAEGFIRIPKVLQRFMGGQEEIRPAAAAAAEPADQDLAGLGDRERSVAYESLADSSPALREFFAGLSAQPGRG